MCEESIACWQKGVPRREACGQPAELPEGICTAVDSQLEPDRCEWENFGLKFDSPQTKIEHSHDASLASLTSGREYKLTLLFAASSKDRTGFLR